MICAACETKRLFKLEHAFASDPVSRVMLLHPELATLLEKGLTDQRIGRLQADLEMFVMGQELALSPVPYEHRTAYMGLLAPEAEGTWEIRSRDPKPDMRVFGRFVQKDCFVALGWSLRSQPDARWPHKQPLGDGKSLQRWAELFPGHDPLTGSDIDELLSEKYHLV